jgi:Flp pilus assembly pilin Flp
MMRNSCVALLAREESGAASVEYALLISGVALVLVAMAFSVGAAVYQLYDTTIEAMDKEM